MDTASTTIASIKHSGHYTLDAFLTSVLYTNLPSKLQTLWEQHSKQEKGIPPVDQLLAFVSEHAETLPAPSPTSGKTPELTPERTTNKKPERRQEPAPHKHKAAIHVTTPANSYKWECVLCKPEKHPLFMCPKWQSFTVAQRLNHITTRGLCRNCLAVGHNTSDCRSSYKCRECNQAHHTTIHQATPATPINSATPAFPKMPDAPMMTEQQ